MGFEEYRELSDDAKMQERLKRARDVVIVGKMGVLDDQDIRTLVSNATSGSAYSQIEKLKKAIEDIDLSDPEVRAALEEEKRLRLLEQLRTMFTDISWIVRKNSD